MINFDLLKSFFSLLLVLFSINCSWAQNAMKGKEFWLGFLQNNESEANIKLLITISSEVNTSGIVSIPLQGWSSAFTVPAGGTISVSIPAPIGENTISGVIQNKGIKITSNDSISVFAANHAGFTTDASFIIPEQNLRSEYFILTYNAYSSWPNDMLIVAGNDNTVIDIIPSVTTVNGNPAGVAFSITLNAGQTYLLKSASGMDISGTQVKGKDQCVAFAVFAGAKIANIPNNCVAADHIFNQMLPLDYFGQDYFITPVNGLFTLRILASENNTSINIDGVITTSLNAGQYYTLHNQSGAKHISSNNPFMVAQFLQGSDCSGSGDPAMAILAPIEQKYKKVNFSTLDISNITKHFVNIVVETQYSNQVLLNGNNIGSGFIAFPSAASYSYQQVEIQNGYHLIEASSGVIANVLGVGGWNSYFFSAGYKGGDINSDFTFVAPVCAGLPVTFTGSGNGVSSSYWDFGDGNTATGASVQHNYDLPGTFTVTLIIGKNSSCPDTISKTIEVPLAPIVDVVSDTTICGNASILINAEGNANSFLWSTGDTTSFIITDNPGIYWLKTSNETCTTIDTVRVHKLSHPILSLNREITFCQNSFYELNPQGDNSLKYNWSTGDTSMIINVNQEGIYWVEASNYCGSAIDSAMVKIEPAPIIYAGTDTTILLGTSAQLEAKGGSNYTWFPPIDLNCTTCPNPTASPKETTTYKVLVMGENGCYALDSVTVFIDPDLLVFIPNIFSPNGDGNNDIFYVRGKGIMSFNLMVFNRWGEKVFETTDLNHGWDGTFRGKQLPPSVFVYYLDAFLLTEQRVIKKGDITLIR
ncbi:MAG: gliding motility-associated C-terminal domain-containing protein [Bacteroidota bacterium]|nr:gliding motility-associated C-terminal domain-containing protein [Bacteroidota bacterium]